MSFGMSAFGRLSLSSVRGGGTAASVPTVTLGYIMDGDSITEGPNYIPVRPPRPEILSTTTGLTATNLGVSGRTLQTMDSTFGSRGVGGLFNAGSTNTLILFGGINDILNTAGVTLANLQGYMTSYAAKAVAAGFRFFVGTLLPTADASWTAGKETLRTGFNTWLKANYASLGAAGVIDYAAIAQAADPNDTTYYVDKLHPTPRLLGLMVLAEVAATGRAIVNRAINPNFTTSANLGGWFGYSYTSGFVKNADNSIMSLATNRLRLSPASNKIYPEAYLPIDGLTIGQTYTVSYDLATNVANGGTDNGIRVAVKDTLGGGFQNGTNRNNDVAVKTAPARYSTTFTAAASSQFLCLQGYSATVGAYVEVDNVVIA